jgi:hypothetical protein
VKERNGSPHFSRGHGVASVGLVRIGILAVPANKLPAVATSRHCAVESEGP